MSWKGELLHDIHDNLSPNEFEKFVYNLLENIGFSELELLGQSGDGGIDLKACARARAKNSSLIQERSYMIARAARYVWWSLSSEL